MSLLELGNDGNSRKHKPCRTGPDNGDIKVFWSLLQATAKIGDEIQGLVFLDGLRGELVLGGGRGAHVNISVGMGAIGMGAVGVGGIGGHLLVGKKSLEAVKWMSDLVRSVDSDNEKPNSFLRSTRSLWTSKYRQAPQ